MTMKVWAWSEGVANFGDELGPAILKRLGHAVERVPEIADADIVACGSVLECVARHAKPGTRIWGAGLASAAPVDVGHLDVRAVRGALTRDLLGVDVPTGDPGCVVPLLWPAPAATRYRVGVVRHYVDRREYPWADAVMDSGHPVDEVIAFIGACEAVASSSLHGLIVAAAYGRRTLRLHHPDVAHGEFKWMDWFSASNDAAKLLEAL